MSLIDLAGVFLVCATTLACFLIRSSHGTDVEELAATADEAAVERAKDKATLADLQSVVTHNAREFAVFKGNVQTRMNLGPK